MFRAYQQPSKLIVSGPLTVSLEVPFAIHIQPPDDGLLIHPKHVEVCKFNRLGLNSMSSLLLRT
jgi:hypothetical protein